MGRKILYKCPFCEKCNLYESRNRAPPKYPKTNCKACGLDIKVFPHFVGHHANQNSSTTKISGSDPKLTQNLPDINNQIPLTVNDQLRKTPENTPKIPTNVLSEKGSVGIDPTLTGVSNYHQNCNYDPKKMFSVHCIRFKVDLISEPTQKYFKWDIEKPMKGGWIRKVRYFADYNIELTNKSIIINLSRDIYANNALACIDFAQKYAEEILKYLWSLGFTSNSDLKSVQKPHIVFPEIMTPEMPGKFIFTTKDGKMVVDDTPHENAIEVIGIDTLQKMAQAPTQIEQMGKLIQMQTELIAKLMGQAQQNEIKEKDREKKNDHIYL